MQEKFDFFKLKSKRYSIKQLLKCSQKQSQYYSESELLNFDELNEDQVLKRSVDNFIQVAYSHLTSDGNSHANPKIPKIKRESNETSIKEKRDESKIVKSPCASDNSFPVHEKDNVMKLNHPSPINSPDQKENRIHSPILQKILKKKPNGKPSLETNKTDDKLMKTLSEKNGRTSFKKDSKITSTNSSKFNKSAKNDMTTLQKLNSKLDRSFLSEENSTISNTGESWKSEKNTVKSKALFQDIPKGVDLKDKEHSFTDKNNLGNKVPTTAISQSFKTHFYPNNCGEVKEKNLPFCDTKPDMFRMVEQSVPYRQLDIGSQKIELQSPLYNWQMENSLNKSNPGMPFLQYNSSSLEQMYLTDSYVPNYLVNENSCDLDGQFSSQNYCQWTTSNFIPSYQEYSGESYKFPVENNPFGYNQWTPLWGSYHNDPDTSDIENEYGRNYMRGSYFGPAESIIRNRLRLSNGTDLGTPLTEL